jgi:hypothetical protein
MPLINFSGGPFATRLNELLLCHAQWLASTAAAAYPIRHCYFSFALPDDDDDDVGVAPLL